MPGHSTNWSRCGIDTVEIARMERLLAGTPVADLRSLFSEQELADGGDGAGRAASLAARLAAKEACLKLFPRELALGEIEPGDFSVARDNYGAPRAVLSPVAQAVLARHRLRGISLSLTHDGTSAAAVALAEPAEVAVPGMGRFLYRFAPLRRKIVRANLRHLVAGTPSAADIDGLAAAHYWHQWRRAVEYVQVLLMPASRQRALVRIENLDALLAALAQGRGVLVLTGHTGNWAIAAAAVMGRLPQMRGRLHIVGSAQKPKLYHRLVPHRVRQVRLGLSPGRDVLAPLRACLQLGDILVFPLEEQVHSPESTEVELPGRPACTSTSLATMALATGAPVLPATAWREPDGRHVLRFEAALPPVECEVATEAVRRTTLVYKRVLERLVLCHPEQWYGLQRRWIDSPRG
jgi:KDO2-lipid IV(A) lauroyltransferase